MGCKGIHCPGCEDGRGAGIAAVVILLVLAVIASKAKAISHGMAEVGHVLVLVAIAGASVTLATVTVTGAVLIRRRLRRIEHATGQMHATLGRIERATLASHGYRELPEPRADIPTKVYIHPPREQGRVSR